MKYYLNTLINTININKMYASNFEAFDNYLLLFVFILNKSVTHSVNWRVTYHTINKFRESWNMLLFLEIIAVQEISAFFVIFFINKFQFFSNCSKVNGTHLNRLDLSETIGYHFYLFRICTIV